MYKLKKELYTVCILTILLPTLTACGLTTSIPKAITNTSIAQLTEIPSTIPTALPSVTPTVRPTPTIAPMVEAPQFWIENQTVLEQNGYVLVASAIGWEVQYKGQTVFTDKEAEYTRFTPISTDAGPSMVFIQVDESGQVEKFYNPQVNPTFGSPEWDDFLDISLDPASPSEVDIDQVHSGQVLLSALIKNGTEQWWQDDALPYAIVVTGQGNIVNDTKSTEMTLYPFAGAGRDFDYLPPPSSRFLGFLSTNFYLEQIEIGMVQTLVSGDGKTATLNAGYSGMILDYHFDNGDDYMLRVPFGRAGDEWFWIYRAINDWTTLARNPGITDYSAIHDLYQQDSNNQPWLLFPELLAQLKALENTPGNRIDVLHTPVDPEVVRMLQFQILYSLDVH